MTTLLRRLSNGNRDAAEQAFDALEAAERIAELERILDSVPQDAIDGGWTAAGIRQHAKQLEQRIAELEAERDQAARQEPVAEMKANGDGAKYVDWYCPLDVGTKLYAAPVRPDPLTDEEISKISHRIAELVVKANVQTHSAIATIAQSCIAARLAFESASPVRPLSDAEIEFPAGAIHNAVAFSNVLENIYDFDCQAGPLRNCWEWIELRRCLVALTEYAEKVNAIENSSQSDLTMSTHEKLRKLMSRLGIATGEGMENFAAAHEDNLLALIREANGFMDRAILAAAGAKNVQTDEPAIVIRMQDMCAESLCPDTYDKWLEVKDELRDTRRSLRAAAMQQQKGAQQG